MGIPKMFRWLSERYPLCSQLIEGNNIPEFDNLYLDMNGIIHNATHANRGAHQVLKDEEMFTSIFNYIDNLVHIIKPKKVFYMAVDGVAPRAKMNQQRARRFRTALDRELEMKKLEKKGEKVKEDAFDSNCITPGTEFMTKLTDHLRYLIHKKTTEDACWRDLDIILSSHEVPGEGEHKIMEYIRCCKAQPDYQPNLRHCLYGLDADLIMLGLLSHEPHFALLREEVTFGKTKQTSNAPASFYLLHLSVVREYLSYDFNVDHAKMKFPFDTERIIDDFVMMVMFIGNDFLPHLPGFDIGEGVLSQLFNAYSVWLIKGDGYLSDAGTINLPRLEVFLRSLDHHEYKRFLKLPEHDKLLERVTAYGTITDFQSQILAKIRVTFDQQEEHSQFSLRLPEIIAFKDIDFLKNLAEEIGMLVTSDYTYDDPDHPRLVYSLCSPDIQFKLTGKSSLLDGSLNEESLAKIKEIGDSDSNLVEKVMMKFSKMSVKSKDEEDKIEEEAERMFDEWKAFYYKTKLKIEEKDSGSKRKMVQSYIEGIQWVMYYYFRGIPSWSWFYPYHYAPMLSDLAELDKVDLNFEKGKPFLPFEQLMGVLPSRSKHLVPAGFRELMTNPGSTIIDFYPEEFEMDQNGKRNEWEAIVLIPFIDQDRLLKAMKEQERLLTDAERARNSFGESFMFRFDPAKTPVHIPSTFPGYYPDIKSSCIVTNYKLPPGPPNGIFTARLCEGVKKGKDAPAGFPSLQTLSHDYSIVHGGIQVFDRPSKQDTVALNINSQFGGQVDLSQLTKTLLGKIVYIGYPFLQEAKVMKIENKTGLFNLKNQSSFQATNNPEEFQKKFDGIKANLFTKQAVKINDDCPDILVHVAPFLGLTQTPDGSLVQRFAEANSEFPTYPLQMIVNEVVNVDERHKPQVAKSVQEEYPLQSRVFFLGDKFYGFPGRVASHPSNKNNNDTLINVIILHQDEPSNLSMELAKQAKFSTQYIMLRDLSKQLRCSVPTLSRLTSQIKLTLGGNQLNVGLGLKFEARNLMVVEYCRKVSRGWEFSPLGCQLIANYCREFPELIRFLDKQTQFSQAYLASEVFPGEGKATERMEVLRGWLSTNGVDKFQLSPVGSESLSKHIVLQIQQHWDNFLLTPTKFNASVVKDTPRSTVIRPSEPGLALDRQTFELGHRVICVIEGGKVPIGSKGTVIGKEDVTRLEILFDRSFASGTDLNGRCAPHRGLWTSSASFLNVDLPQLTPAKLQNFLNRAPHQPPSAQSNVTSTATARTNSSPNNNNSNSSQPRNSRPNHYNNNNSGRNQGNSGSASPRLNHNQQYGRGGVHSPASPRHHPQQQSSSQQRNSPGNSTKVNHHQVSSSSPKPPPPQS